MVKNIAVYTEGPTEWYAIRTLAKREILAGAQLMGAGKRDDIRHWLKPPNDLQSVFNTPPPETAGFFLLYDQEMKPDPDVIYKEMIAQYRLNVVSGDIPLFTLPETNLPVAIHVANNPGWDGNRDFDGYILDIIKRAGADLVQNLYKDEKCPAYLRSRLKQQNVNEKTLYDLGVQAIPERMTGANWPPFRAKTGLYAYSTALQLNRSHVWLAEKVVEVAPDDLLRDVFAALIATWNALVEKIA